MKLSPNQRPLPTTSLVDERPAQKAKLDTKPASRSRADELPDIAYIEKLQDTFHQLRAPGIHARQWVTSGEFRVRLDVEQDTSHVCELRKGQALMTSGVATCYAVCARSRKPDGTTLVGIYHASSLGPPGLDPQQTAHFFVRTVVQEMLKAGAATRPQLFIVGGQVSLFVREPKTSVAGGVAKVHPGSDDGTIYDGECLLRAAGDLLVSARIGLSETEELPESELEQYRQQGYSKCHSTGRPSGVNVYITEDEVFYIPNDGQSSDDDVSDEGDTSDEDGLSSTDSSIAKSHPSAEGGTPAIGDTYNKDTASGQSEKSWPDDL
jgi:hypothetical protein